MTSTPRRASWWPISTFSRVLRWMPGDCSPSRRVVSKIVTRLAGSCCGTAARRRSRWSPPHERGFEARSGPAHPGMGVGKLPLPGEEPTKPPGGRATAGCDVRGVHEHAPQDTGARPDRANRALTSPAGWRRCRGAMPATSPPIRRAALAAPAPSRCSPRCARHRRRPRPAAAIGDLASASDRRRTDAVVVTFGGPHLTGLERQRRRARPRARRRPRAWCG